jgi:hypothetical protein
MAISLQEITDRFKYLSEYNYSGTYEDYQQHTMLLTEMSNFHKNKTGLDVNVWIDEAQTYIQGRHGKRLKFQLDTAEHINKKNFGIITIEDKPKILTYNELPSKITNRLIEFVELNQELLELLADKKIDHDYFLEHMQKIGEPAVTQINPQPVIKPEYTHVIANTGRNKPLYVDGGKKTHRKF